MKLSRIFGSRNDCALALAKQSNSSTPDSTRTISRTDASRMSDEEKGCPPILSNSPPTLATAIGPLFVENEITYPEGGRDAWLVVLGASCGLTASLGTCNTCGVFSAVVSRTILLENSLSTLGWLFPTYAFVNWFGGVLVGPTFDAMGPCALITAGTVCTTADIFTLSVSTEFYQILLSFSILTGIGPSLLLTPFMGCVAHWFMERRGIASGVAFIRGGFGGVLFSLMIQSLLPRVGWARVPSHKGASTSWRDTPPNPMIFVDGTGAMAATTAGVLLTDLAYFIPVTYVPSYYIARQHLSDAEALTGSASFAHQLLAIINATSCVGRAVAGHSADRFGRYNSMSVSLFFCIASVLVFWLPDILVPALPNEALLVIFVALFSFVSGSNVSSTPICPGQLCETQE
ncbi:hypothetical protein LTR66_002408 [Elasticomyces elasticus]|nr:hypothetical protein LTR66_002408 [Elasticomyces elasticus]